MSPCPRAGRWFRGCRFEARYDRKPEKEAMALVMQLRSLDGSCLDHNDIRAIELASDSTYVRDVCTRCGATIERTRGHD